MQSERHNCPDKYNLKSHRPQTGSAGFTLIELIIVLVIIGIASGIVGIMIGRGSGGIEIKTVTKEISSVLRYARNHSVSEKRTYCFVINKEDGVVRLYAHKDETENTNEEFNEEEDMLPVLERPLPADLLISINDDDSEELYMEFFPQGNSSGGTIKLENENGSIFFIDVNRITGRVKVEKDEE
jgi:general secretion pathway protein H